MTKLRCGPWLAVVFGIILWIQSSCLQAQAIEVDVNGFVIHDGDLQDLDGPGNFSVTFDSKSPGAAGFLVRGGRFSASGSVVPGIESVPPHLPGTCCWF